MKTDIYSILIRLIFFNKIKFLLYINSSYRYKLNNDKSVLCNI